MKSGTMETEQIRSIANFVRKCIEQNRSDLRSISFQRFPNGACGDASDILGKVLFEKLKIRCQYVCGTFLSNEIGTFSHAWLEREDGCIIDITADQFDELPRLPSVIVDKNHSFHAAALERKVRPIRLDFDELPELNADVALVWQKLGQAQ